MIAVQTPYTQFFATDGSPLDNGYLYIGLVSQNPETAPAQVFWDFAGTQPAAQPIRLLNGYPARDGTPTPVFTPADYSFTVKDARGQIQYATNFSPSISTSASDVLGQLANQTSPALGAGLVGYLRDGIGAIGSTVWEQLNRFRSKNAAKVMLGGVTVSNNDTEILTVVGSPATPATTIDYRKPVVYAELHTNSAMPDSSDWGNPKKAGAFLAEVLVYGAETGEINAYNGRVFSNTAAPAGAQPLVGASFLAQSNAPAGLANRSVFAANLVATSSTGLSPENIVGIEVDVITSQAIPLTAPGIPGAINATAYWAQSASNVSNSNTALYISSVSTSFGWLRGIYAKTLFLDYGIDIENTLNAPSGKGVRIKTTWQAPEGRVLELFTGTSEQFRVDGSNNSPVWILIEGVLKQITAGAANSGGAGFKFLKVVN